MKMTGGWNYGVGILPVSLRNITPSVYGNTGDVSPARGGACVSKTIDMITLSPSLHPFPARPSLLLSLPRENN